MLNSKICRQHAAKCIETAETIPPGAQREMFFDMAKRWTDLAINIESSEALADPASPPANDPGEPYRFGSRIRKAPDQLRDGHYACFGSAKPKLASAPAFS